MHPRSLRRRRVPALALVGLLLAAALSGCGLIGSGGLLTVSRVRVTTFYGSRTLLDRAVRSLPAGATGLTLLEQLARVRVSGGRVSSVNGIAAGPHQAWSLYVNGIRDAGGPTPVVVTRGDQVWWDLHSTLTGPGSAAVVGAYPEPFANGAGAKRYPAVLTCAPGNDAACAAVSGSLGRAGVKVAFQGIGTGSGSDSLAVLVGTFRQLRGVLADVLLADGPTISGVYADANVRGRGDSVGLEDPSGSIVRTVQGPVGLIAATQQTGLNEPVWLITGTTPGAVRLAAGALSSARLHDAYSLAVLPGGRDLPLPLHPVPGGG